MSERTPQSQVAPAQAPAAAPTAGRLLQRACACGQHTPGGGECAECQKRRLQRAGYAAAPNVAPPVVHEVLSAPGQPLDAATLAFMEPRFGRDLSAVRVHTGASAAESARAVSALAYTVGQQVVFGAGQYAPGSAAGRRLLAHELAHTVQQGGGAVGLQPQLEIGASDDPAEREAERAARLALAGLVVPDLGLTAGAIVRRDDPPAAEVAEASPILADDESFRWVGDPSRPELVIKPAWLRRRGVPRGTLRINGARYPSALRPIIDALVALYPWASQERARRGLASATLLLSEESWSRAEARVPVHSSVFTIIGLPPDAPIQVIFSGDSLVIYIDTTHLYPQAQAGADPDTRERVKTTIAEEATRRLEQELRRPVDGLLRETVVSYIAGRLPDGAAVATINIDEHSLISLFGETEYRAFVERRAGDSEAAGPVIQLGQGRSGVRPPADLSREQREIIEQMLRSIMGDAPSAPAQPNAPTAPPQEATPEPPEAVLTRSDAQALLDLHASPDRDAVLALLRGRRGGGAPTSATIRDIIETARAQQGWSLAEQQLRVSFEREDSDEQPIVPRPVHGQIHNPDRLVPGLEAQFTFETLDNVDAFRVPHVHIHWYAQTIPSEGETTRHIVEDDVTNYIEVDPHSLLNERIFEVTFDQPGTYEIHAFVNHNFFLPAHFVSVVRVTTEAAILEEFRRRAAAGWGAEERQSDYRFADIAQEEAVANTALEVALRLPGVVPGGLPLAPGADLVPDSGYAMGTRAEGRLTEDAASEHAVSLLNREDQLVAERDRLDRMIQQYDHGDEENARDIVEFIRERRARVQAAIDQINALTSGETVVYPVPVRAFFASRTHGISSAPLTLVAYFTTTGEGPDERYHGHLLDQSELLEARHYHFEAEGTSFEAVMESLFLDLTRSYPNGRISFSFQRYDHFEPTDRFIRFERVTDTTEQDIHDVAFSSTANIAVNLIATLLTVFPPTTVIGISIGIAYNAASLAEEIRTDLRRGTFSGERTALQVGQLALDIIPVVGRGSRLLTIGGRTYRAIEIAQMAGMVYLLNEDAQLQIQNLRDTKVSELAQLQDDIRRLEEVNASDPSLDELRRREDRLIAQIRTTSYEVYTELAVTQGLTIGSAALLRHVAGGYVTGRGGATPPEGPAAPRTPEAEPAPRRAPDAEAASTPRRAPEGEGQATRPPAEGEAAPRQTPEAEAEQGRRTPEAEGQATRPPAEPEAASARPAGPESIPEAELLGNPERIRADATSPDGAHAIHVTRDGQIYRCSDICTRLRSVLEQLTAQVREHPTLHGQAEALMERLGRLEQSEAAIRAEEQAAAQHSGEPSPELREAADQLATDLARLENDARRVSSEAAGPRPTAEEPTPRPAAEEPTPRPADSSASSTPRPAAAIDLSTPDGKRQRIAALEQELRGLREEQDRHIELTGIADQQEARRRTAMGYDQNGIPIRGAPVDMPAAREAIRARDAARAELERRRSGSSISADIRRAEGEMRRLRVQLDPSNRAPIPCFSAETLVHTPAGLRRIDSLQPDELVLAWDAATGGVSPRPLIEVYRNCTRHFYRLQIAAEIVQATGQHLFWVVDEQGWVAACDLRPGMQLLMLDGSVARLREVALHEGLEEASYNLSVAELSTYFVGPGVLVHNTGYDLGFGGEWIIYRGTSPNPEFAGKVYIGQTTLRDAEGRPRGTGARETEHHDLANQRLHDLEIIERTRPLTPRELSQRRFYEFMREVQLEPIVTGIPSQAHADYLEQFNIDFERTNVGGPNSVMNRREEIRRASHMEAVLQDIRDDPVLGSYCAPR